MVAVSGLDFGPGEPHFVNPEGVKWWDRGGDVWLVETPAGERDYVGLVDGEIVCVSKQLDDVALRVDLHKLARRWEQE